MTAILERQVNRTRLFDLATGRELGTVPGIAFDGFTQDGREIRTLNYDGEAPENSIRVQHRAVPSRWSYGLMGCVVSALGLLVLALRRLTRNRRAAVPRRTLKGSV